MALGVVCILSATGAAQVMNTGTTLAAGGFSITAAPLVLVNGSRRDLGVYLIGGVGLPRGIDLAVNARFAENRDSYLGGDLEWSLIRGTPSLSLITGAHVYGHVGLDAGINLTFPIRQVAALYTGADLDIEFRSNDAAAPVWIFFGGEVSLRRSISLLLELNLLIHEAAGASHVFGLGLGIFL